LPPIEAGLIHFENWSKTQDRHNDLSWSFDGAKPTEYYAIHNPTSDIAGMVDAIASSGQ
jgi:hypothetical protein